METGHDIIFFWVARMMMLGEWLMGREPFGIVYLHGMVRDPDGAKMSKTRGNVVDPLGVIDEVGADALRFALVNGTAPGMDQKLSPSKLEGARNFANKIWNASRYVLSQRPAELPSDAILSLPGTDALGPAEHWILARCAATLREVGRGLCVVPVRGGDPRCCTPPSGASTATGTWSWPRRSWRRSEAGRDAGRDLAGAGLGARPVPAGAAPGHAPHHGAHLGAPAQEPRRSRTCSSWRAGRIRRPGISPTLTMAAGVGDLLELITAIRNARSDAGIDASTWLAATVVPRSAGAARRASSAWTRRSPGSPGCAWPSPTTRSSSTACPTPWPS